MSLKNNYRATIFAACVGYVVQAIVVNFTPLLFLTFGEQYGLDIWQITVLIPVNFIIQFLTDFVSSRFVSRFGYRKCVIVAHILCAAGLLSLGLLPRILPPFAGIVASVAVFAVGGGLLEVLISPIVEACPTQNKAGFMSLLHSFYCWGVVLSVGLSTLFFSTVGIDRWALLSCLWALLPLLNIILFLIVPIYPNPDEAKGEPPHFRALFRQKIFWLMVLLMVCSGASELAIAQWASTFTESALGVTKTVGDLVGVCGFAVMMAIARSLYARLDTKIPLKTALIACSLLCIGGYLLIGLSSSSVLGLVGCAISGFAVGIFWPASYSTATVRVHKGGTALFSLLALSGDLGCTLGPTLVGAVSGAFGDNFRLGILAAVVFPIVLLIGLVGLHILDRKTQKEKAQS